MPRVNDASFTVLEANEEDIAAVGDFGQTSNTSSTSFDPSKWETVAPPPGTYFEAEQGLNNCALCTAAALVSEDIDVPELRRTAGQVNGDLQQRLFRLLGKKAMEKLWNELPHGIDPRGGKWFETQRDDAFVIYGQNEYYARALRAGKRSERAGKQVDEEEEGDEALADQIIGLAVYVEWKLNTAVRYHGFPGEEKAAPSALGFMRGQPNGTKFAVCTRNGKDGVAVHWIYADKRNGNLVFKDFQLDRDPEPDPLASNHPLGPHGKVYENGLYSTGKGKRDILMYVLAFGDFVVGSGKSKFYPMLNSYARGSFGSVLS
jgi:hypothetical protein